MGSDRTNWLSQLIPNKDDRITFGLFIASLFLAIISIVILSLFNGFQSTWKLAIIIIIGIIYVYSMVFLLDRISSSRRSKTLESVNKNYSSIIRTMYSDNSKKQVKDLSLMITSEITSKSKQSKNESDDHVMPLTTLKNMIYNMASIQSFYDISLQQARRSFATAIIISALGFAFFIGISIMVLVYDVPSSSAVIPAIGGTLIEVIAATVFIIYRKSLEQMNHYFKSLMINEKLLLSINLVEYISEGKQDDMYSEIIRSHLENKDKID